MGLKSFINELKDPSLKCERVGHNFREYVRRGYYPGGFVAVVTEVFQTTRKCKRCGYTEEWKTDRKKGIQSFSAPSELMHKIDSHDEEDPYWIEYWWGQSSSHPY